MIFTGHAELTIDAQGRLQIPSKFRGVWNPLVHGEHWICIPWPEEGGMLRLFPEKFFERIGTDAPESLTPTGSLGALEAQLFGMAETVKPDSAGRIKLHPAHVELVGLPREVVLLGVRNRLEVRARDAWKSSFAEIFRKLPQLAQEMKPGGNANPA